MALFCYQAKKWIGSFAAALGGLDTLVFAGGIGENASLVRARICEGLSFLGIELNESRNAETAGVISADASRATVRVIRTDEEQMIARSVCRVLGLNLASEERNSDHATKHVSRLDERRDVALEGDRRTGGGPAGHRDDQAVQETTVRSGPACDVNGQP